MGSISGLQTNKPVRMMSWGGDVLSDPVGAVQSNVNQATSDPVGYASNGYRDYLNAITLGGGDVLLGKAGSALGPSGAAPELGKIQQGTSIQDVTDAQKGAANSLAAQQSLLQALQGQNGIGNQSEVFNQSQGLANQLGGANAVANQSSALNAQQQLAAQQQATAQQYQNIANGTGPNPAQAALNNATGQNVANQAALMASQRGAGANIGLIGRQAAMQGANTQQQAVGQGAQMQAQQQLAGLSGLTNQQQAIGSTNQNVAGIASQQLAAQQAQQQALAQQANAQVNQQVAATTANSQGQLANQQQMQNALQGVNSANVANQGNVNSGNVALSTTHTQGQQGILGGVLSGFGGALGSMGGATAGAAAGAEGGDVTEMPRASLVSDEESYPKPVQASSPPSINGPSSSFGNFLHNWGVNNKKESQDQTIVSSSANPGSSSLQKGTGTAMKGLVTAIAAAKGGVATKGGTVKAQTPDQKAVKKGNSYDNDKVPALLSEGEIVIPRAVLQSKDPARGAAEFVAKIMAKRGKR